MCEGITILCLTTWLYSQLILLMNKYYKNILNIKKSYFLNLLSQINLNVGDKVYIIYTKEEKKIYNFSALVVSKKFTIFNHIITVYRYTDENSVRHILNLNSLQLKDILVLKKKALHRAKLYYTYFLNEKVIETLF